MAALCRMEVARFDELDADEAWAAVADTFDADRASIPGDIRPVPAGGGDPPGRGSRPEAAATLGIARTTAARLGAAPLLGEIDRLARQARLEVPPRNRSTGADGSTPDSASGHDLTEREVEVLSLIAAGWSN